MATSTRPGRCCCSVTRTPHPGCPALDALGKSEHWRILNLTKSACPIPSVTVAVRGKVAADCAKWRTNALAKIKSIHPDLVIGTSIDHVYTIPGKSGCGLPAGMAGGHDQDPRRRSGPGPTRSSCWADSPLWQQEAPACLRAHPSNIGKCATKRSTGRVPGQDRQRPPGGRRMPTSRSPTPRPSPVSRTRVPSSWADICCCAMIHT